MDLTAGEQSRRDEAVERIERLRLLLCDGDYELSAASTLDMLAFLSQIKRIVGNANLDIGFFATLLAKDYLGRRFALIPFDASAKAQGANGLDIDERTVSGERVIGEIKTTSPYLGDRLGSAQLAGFATDFEKLRLADASHKFFFVTDPASFDIARAMLHERQPDVQVVQLGRSQSPA